MMTNKEIIEAVIHWQTKLPVHQMTCKNDSQILIPKEDSEIDKVILVCLDCDYIQTWIPKVVRTCRDNKKVTITTKSMESIAHSFK
jgi:hypothetical protein